MNMEKFSWPGWETVDTIGSGSFGTVYEIQRTISGQIEKAALKVIQIPKNSSDIDELYSDGYDEESITSKYDDHLNSILAEYNLMRQISGCNNVVRCDDVRYERRTDCVGWNVLIKMELLTSLKKALPAVIPEATVIKMAKDICNALVWCKKYDIIHRDIKPQNLFISSNGNYKLGDFGIAKVSEKTSYGTNAGTKEYMAPEVYNNQPYGASADIYSLGLVMYWMLNNRRLPFLPTDTKKITFSMEEEAKKRRFSGERISAPLNGSDALKAIVLKACEFNPKDRYLSAEQMLEDLNSINLSRNRTDESNSKHVKTEPKLHKKPTANESSKLNNNLDVYLSIQLTVKKAKKGCNEIIELKDGRKVDVTIPAGVKNGDVLRLRGTGKKDIVTGKQGDVFLKVKIDNVDAKSDNNNERTNNAKVKVSDNNTKKFKLKSLLVLPAWIIWICVVGALASFGFPGIIVAILMVLVCVYGEYLIYSEKNKKRGQILVLVVPIICSIPASLALLPGVGTVIIVGLFSLLAWLI